MRIGIDIDETLTDTKKSFYETLEKYQIMFNGEYHNWHQQESAQLIVNNHLEEIMSKAKLKDRAKEVLDELYNRGHELFIITARSNNYCSCLETITNQLVKDNDLNIKEVYFNQDEKSVLAKKLGIDLMIDDSASVYQNMQKEKIDCILFGDKITTWTEVLEYINKKEEIR